MDSWWQLGEWTGFQGGSLATYRITCPFCLEKGNFNTESHLVKKKPNSDKRLNFDTLKCGNCSGYVMVLWSASEYAPHGGLHDYKVLPWPLRIEKHPDHWPATMGRFWLQAKRNLADENWDAAVVMARAALQSALRDHGASGGTLMQEIDGLAKNGTLPPIMSTWSHEVRQLGNTAAHPDPGQEPVSGQDARDLLSFLDFFLECVYSLPYRIQQYRQRAKEQQ